MADWLLQLPPVLRTVSTVGYEICHSRTMAGRDNPTQKFQFLPQRRLHIVKANAHHIYLRVRSLQFETSSIGIGATSLIFSFDFLLTKEFWLRILHLGKLLADQTTPEMPSGCTIRSDVSECDVIHQSESFWKCFPQNRRTIDWTVRQWETIQLRRQGL